MSDEAHSLRTIDWRTVFPFTQLFRAFRIAIHPAKLALALLAILLVYGIGRTMDGLWLDRHQAVPGEIAMYERAPSRAAFSREVEAARTDMADSRKAKARQLAAENQAIDATRTPLPENASYSQMKEVVVERRDRDIKLAHEAYDKAGEKTPEVAAARDTQIRAAYGRAGSDLALLRQATGQGLCLTFVNHQTTQINNIAKGVATFNWTGTDGVLPSLHRFIFTGPGWALSKHPLYFTIFTIIALLVWSVIGGAIARIAAVQVSQDEKISVRQALRFSTNKLMSFFAAPVMPLILIGIIALILATLGKLTEIPYAGGLLTIVMGLLFFILIAVGVLVACALIGWVCGFGLMYPTIAVEGSDAFDAVSRSFSYVFARPWKVFIYSLIALVYGALTYLFLRFIAFLTLTVLHECLTFWTRSAGPTGGTSIANAWTGPGPEDFYNLTRGPIDPYSLTTAETLASTMIMFWVMLFVALLGAYLLSFFVSVNTIMYYLLRHEVDATDIDDVYLEPSEDEFEDALPESATGTATKRSEAASSVPASAMTERAMNVPATSGSSAPITDRVTERTVTSTEIPMTGSSITISPGGATSSGTSTVSMSPVGDGPTSGTTTGGAPTGGSSTVGLPTPLSEAPAGPMATTPRPDAVADVDPAAPLPPNVPPTSLPPTPPPAGS